MARSCRAMTFLGRVDPGLRQDDMCGLVADGSTWVGGKRAVVADTTNPCMRIYLPNPKKTDDFSKHQSGVNAAAIYPDWNSSK